jgi:SAM-dependent methyltransferase
MSEISIPDISFLRGPVSLSHVMLLQFVRPGDCVVDATCGNGNDTLLLARLTGTNGQVWAFDIQQTALILADAALEQAGLRGQVILMEAGHETMSIHVTAPLKAVVFNLGYLPAGDRSLVTRPETTLSALEQALSLLVPGGVITLTVYPRHPGGSDEQAAVESWAAVLKPEDCHVWRMCQPNAAINAPYMLLIQKAR